MNLRLTIFLWYFYYSNIKSIELFTPENMCSLVVVLWMEEKNDHEENHKLEGIPFSAKVYKHY